MNTRTPTITYGLRGIAYFKVTVAGPAKDLHSGVFGRTVHEPMTDLVLLMSKLVDASGRILVPGVDEMVPDADDNERSGSLLVLVRVNLKCYASGQSMKASIFLLPTLSTLPAHRSRCQKTRSLC
jgi:acetylornithine deacetylase/succinyl-diaminopimelate desuccinylase-like protein